MPRAAKVAVEKKVKAKKDPNAPKKGLSGFMFFSQEQRPIVKEENPKASFGEFLLATCFLLSEKTWREREPVFFWWISVFLNSRNTYSNK